MRFRLNYRIQAKTDASFLFSSSGTIVDKFKLFKRFNIFQHIFLSVRKHPAQIVLTTTPKKNRLTKYIYKLWKNYPLTVFISRMTTFDNQDNLPESYLKHVTSVYSGTHTARTELFGRYPGIHLYMDEDE